MVIKSQLASEVNNLSQEQAADGDALAEWRLGVIYLDGQGVAKDLSTARAWLAKSAAQGNADAKSELGALPTP
jgi:TPR repeat protein